eukprot:6503999-Pyramimonas_sp.AAC.1
MSSQLAKCAPGSGMSRNLWYVVRNHSRSSMILCIRDVRLPCATLYTCATRLRSAGVPWCMSRPSKRSLCTRSTARRSARSTLARI